MANINESETVRGNCDEREPRYTFKGDADCFPEEHGEDETSLFRALATDEDDCKALIRRFLKESSLNETKNRSFDDVLVRTLEGNAPADEPSLRIARTVVTAVVRNFDRVADRREPGTTKAFRPSAAVEYLWMREPQIIKVDKEVFAEQEPAAFLAEYPAKTAADSAPIEISTADMQAVLPKDSSTIFELVRPVLSVHSTKLVDRELVRMVVILHRGRDDGIRASLYGVPLYFLQN